MKKLFTLLLTMVLLASFSLTAYADVAVPAWADPVAYKDIQWYNGTLKDRKSVV